MRIPYLFCGAAVVLLSSVVAFGQDSNFSSGAQYLMNGASPLFARSISTPSTSLASAPLAVGADDATGVLIAGASNQDISPPRAVALPKIDLFPIFYGGPPVSENGKISFSEPLEPVTSPPQAEVPVSILGVSHMTTIHALHERGFGVTLAEAAMRAKAVHRTSRMYTNADVERLRGGE